MKKVWKQILAVLLVVLLLCGTSPLGALADALSFAAAAESYVGSCGGQTTWSLDTSTGVLSIVGTGLISNYASGTSPWYAYRESVQTVTIGSGVTSIGMYAFADCANLVSVSVPESVGAFGDHAFQNCASLADITLGSHAYYIGSHTFSGCASLTGLTIPNGMECVNAYAFSGCTSLESMTIPDSVSYLGCNVCQNCTSLTNVVIGNGLTCAIGSRAFRNCGNLTSITIGSGAVSVEAYAFENCTSLASIVLPDTVETIEWYAFNNCTSLASVTIPNGVTSIGNRAFYGCTNLLSVTIPNSVTTLDEYAFAGCTSLASASIGSGVTNIPQYAFYGCTGLETLTIASGTQSIGIYAFEKCKSLLSVTIPDSVTSLGMRSFAYCDNLTTVTIGNGVTSIPDSAFCACGKLTNLTIGSGVRSIERIAFLSCTSLVNLTIPYGVESIGNFAFSECTSLATVTIADSVTSIGGSAFYNCKSLTSISLPANITTISASMLYGCESLVNLTIPSGVTSICDGAFLACKSLASITVPSGVTSIDSRVFQGCRNLTSVTLPSGLTSIGYSAFSDCMSLPNITIPSGVTSIGDSAFSNCRSLTSITIPSGVATIGNSVFRGCRNLTSLTIQNNITSIGASAFADCSGLTSVAIADSVTTIGDSAFATCLELKSVTIGSGVESIGNGAFSVCLKLSDVYYNGNQTQWDAITIGTSNNYLQNAAIHYLVDPSLHTHSFTAEITTPATCTTDGLATYTCTCGASYTEVLPAWGAHRYDSVVTAPTCTAAGFTTYTCSGCGDTYTADETPAKGHVFTDWHVIIEPTTQTPGMEIRNCTRCGYVERNILDELPTGYGFFSGGDGTAADPLQIADEEDFCNIDDFFAYYGDELPTTPVYFVQTSTLLLEFLDQTGAEPDSPYVQAYPKLQSYVTTPVSVMHDAVYDGGGYTISMGSVLDSDYAGLFGLVTDSTIRNLDIWLARETVLSTAANGCTGVIARAENCQLDSICVHMWDNSWFASWTDSANVGVLAGCAVNCSVQNCIAQTHAGGVSFIGGATADFTSRNNWWSMELVSRADYSPQYVRNVTGVVFEHWGAHNLIGMENGQLVIPSGRILLDAQGNLQPDPPQYDPTATGLSYDMLLADHVTFAAGANGTLTGAGSVVLYGECEQTVTVTGLTPIPDPGYVFGGWSVTSRGDSQSPVSPIRRTLTQQADGTYTFSTYITQELGVAEVTANFVPHEPHTFTDWTVTTQATTEAAGEQTRTCTVCGYVDTQSIPQLTTEPAVMGMTVPMEPIHTGDTIEVSIDLSQNPGLSGLSIKLHYDPNVLTLMDVQRFGMLLTGEIGSSPSLDAQPFVLAWLDALAPDSHTETGRILTFTFAVSETAPLGETTVTVTYEDADSAFGVDLDNVPLIVPTAVMTVVLHTPGDSDGDGQVGLTDAARTARYLAGGWGEEIDTRNADVNGDGKVNLKDVTLLRRYIAGWDVVIQ